MYFLLCRTAFVRTRILLICCCTLSAFTPCSPRAVGGRTTPKGFNAPGHSRPRCSPAQCRALQRTAFPGYIAPGFRPPHDRPRVGGVDRQLRTRTAYGRGTFWQLSFMVQYLTGSPEDPAFPTRYFMVQYWPQLMNTTMCMLRRSS